MTAANATQVTVTGADKSSYTLQPSGGTQTITAGSSSILTVSATNATQDVVTGSDNSSYTLQPNGGTPVEHSKLHIRLPGGDPKITN